MQRGRSATSQDIQIMSLRIAAIAMIIQLREGTLLIVECAEYACANILQTDSQLNEGTTARFAGQEYAVRR